MDGLVVDAEKRVGTSPAAHLYVCVERTKSMLWGSGETPDDDIRVAGYEEDLTEHSLCFERFTVQKRALHDPSDFTLQFLGVLPC